MEKIKQDNGLRLQPRKFRVNRWHSRKFLALVGLFALACSPETPKSFVQKGLGTVIDLPPLNFTVTRHRLDGADTVSEKRWYNLDVNTGFYSETKLANGDTLRCELRPEGAFQFKNGLLADTDTVWTSRVRQQRYYNFLYLVHTPSAWAALRDTTHQGTPVKVISVTDPSGEFNALHLFVEKATGRILSSSTPENGGYTYFADELDFQPIPNTRIVFPMRYRVMERGICTAWGEFGDFEIAQ